MMPKRNQLADVFDLSNLVVSIFHGKQGLDFICLDLKEEDPWVEQHIAFKKNEKRTVFTGTSDQG
jgi:hypothetical protein